MKDPRSRYAGSAARDNGLVNFFTFEPVGIEDSVDTALVTDIQFEELV